MRENHGKNPAIWPKPIVLNFQSTITIRYKEDQFAKIKYNCYGTTKDV